MLTAMSLWEVMNGPFSSHLLCPKKSSHIDLCTVEGIRGKIEKVMRGNT